jgi:hypothetical protein
MDGFMGSFRAIYALWSEPLPMLGQSENHDKTKAPSGVDLVHAKPTLLSRAALGFKLNALSFTAFAVAARDKFSCRD